MQAVPVEKIYIFLGPPGAGKGTISNVCVRQLGWSQLSTGNLCRKHIKLQTKIGKEIDLIIKTGKLISDDLIIEMVNEWFNQELSSLNVVILDGYPRTVAQAQALNRFLHKKFVETPLSIVRFAIPDNEVVKRLMKRYICQNNDCQAVYSLQDNSDMLAPKTSMVCDYCGNMLIRRSDDEYDSIIKRLVVYHRHEQELVRFYEHNKYVVTTIPADTSLEHMFLEFKRLAGII